MPYQVDMQLDVKVPMRDGITLSADIYRPHAPGRFPTILIRTPYNNNSPDLAGQARALANLGYVCLVQDVRGRWDSDGSYYPMHQEGPDSYDTQEWIGRQPWSNGRIGTSGGSYVGMVQWQSAPYRSQYLTCMAPLVTFGDSYSKLLYPGGALQLGVAITWGMAINARSNQLIEHHNWTEAFRTLPLQQMDELAGRTLPFWKDWLAHQTYDDYWAQINVEEKWGEIAVPALNIGGWYDIFISGTFANFNGLRQHGRTNQARGSRLIVGPWVHAVSQSPKVGDIDFGAHSMIDLQLEQVRWFDYWLKEVDNGVANDAPLRLFIMGRNEWRDEQEWPLARTDWQTWYLHSGGTANTLRGDGTLAPALPADEPDDHFIYDPRYPVQTTGGTNCCWPEILPWGPYDQRPVEMRADVLCYTSEPLAADLEVTGPIKLILYATSDAPDTDWTAKLVDVSPSGYARNLCDGIIRARYRESLSKPTLLEPGQIYQYEIDLGMTGNVFRQGHQLRLEVSSSNFPRYARNLNTGRDPATDTELRPARQTIHHNQAYPSHLILPVIPPGG